MTATKASNNASNFDYINTSSSIHILQNTLKISDLSKLVAEMNTNNAIPDVTIAVDQLIFDVDTPLEVSTFLLMIIARKIVVAVPNNVSIILNNNDYSQATILTGGFYDTQGNPLLQQQLSIAYPNCANSPIVLNWDNAYVINIFLNENEKENKIATFIPILPTLNNIGNFWISSNNFPVVNLLKMQLINAKTQYIQSGSTADIANTLTWVTQNVGSILSNGYDYDMQNMLTEASAVATTISAGSLGSRFVPLLSSSTYVTYLNSLLGLITSYESQISNLNNLKNQDVNLAEEASISSKASQNAVYALYQQLQMENNKQEALNLELNNAFSLIKSSKTDVQTAYNNMVTAIKEEQKKNEIKFDIMLSLGIVLAAVLIAGMVVAPEAAGPGLAAEGGAVAAEAGTVAGSVEVAADAVAVEGEAGVTAMEDILDNGTTLQNLFAEPKALSFTEKAIGNISNIIAQAKSLIPAAEKFKNVPAGMMKVASAANAANQFWTVTQNYVNAPQASGTTIDANSELSEYQDTNNNSKAIEDNYTALMLNSTIDGQDPSTYWDDQVMNLKDQCKDLGDKATDYIDKFTVLANQMKNYYSLLAQVIDLRSKSFVTYSHIQSLVQTEADWTNLQNMQLAQADIITQSIQLLIEKKSKIVYSFCQAFNDYKAAYFYSWLAANNINVNMNNDATELQAAMTNSLQQMNYMLQGGNASGNVVTIPSQDFNSIKVTIPMSNITILPSVEKPALFNTLSFTIHPNDTLSNFPASQSLYITDAQFLLEGIPTTSQTICLTINTSGVYHQVHKGISYNFSGAGVSMDFIYTQPNDVNTSWEPSSMIAAFYMKPSPYTVWTMKIPTDIDITGLSSINIDFQGYYLS